MFLSFLIPSKKGVSRYTRVKFCFNVWISCVYCCVQLKYFVVAFDTVAVDQHGPQFRFGFHIFLSGVEVFAGFGAKVVLGSSLTFGWSLLSAGASRTEYGLRWRCYWKINSLNSLAVHSRNRTRGHCDIWAVHMMYHSFEYRLCDTSDHIRHTG